MQATGLETSVWLTWTPWLIVSGLIFLIIWLRNAAIVVTGGESLDRRLAGLRGDVFLAYREGLANGLRAFARWVGEPDHNPPLAFSALSFWVCAGAAVVYPFLFWAIGWISGGAGSFAGLNLLPDFAFETRFQVAALLLFIAVFPLVGPWALRRKANVLSAFLISLLPSTIASIILLDKFGYGLGYGYNFVVIVVAAVGFVNGITSILTYQFGGTISGALLCAFATTIAATIAIAGTGFFITLSIKVFGVGIYHPNLSFLSFIPAGIFALLVVALCERLDLQKAGAFVIPVLVPTLFLAPTVLAILSGTGAIMNISMVQKEVYTAELGVIALPVVLFLALLPALNAPLDWASLGTSRWIMHILSQTHESWIKLFNLPIIGETTHLVIIIFDLFLAVFFATAIVFVTVAGLALFSEVHAWAGGAALYDVLDIIAQIRANPADPTFAWIYAMMFWTLVPTLVHSMAWAGMVFTSLVLKPLGVAQWLAASSESAHNRGSFFDGVWTTFLLAVLQLSPGLMLIYLLGFQYGPDILQAITALFGVGNPIAFFGNLLLDWSEAIARAIQG